MISLKNQSRQLATFWHIYKKEIAEIIDLSFYEFRSKPDSVLIYFYNEDLLNKVLSDKNVRQYLYKLGYGQCLACEKCLYTLKDKFNFCCPHEVGIFLGYPLDDVMDFKDCKRKKKLKCTGYWKCYNNMDFALESFKSFDNAKIEQIDKFISIH